MSLDGEWTPVAHKKQLKYKLLTDSYEQEPEQILNITPTFSGE